jgi:hypothetical protein
VTTNAANHLKYRLRRAVSKLRGSWRGQQAVHIYELLDQDEPTHELVQYVDWLLHWTHGSASQFKAVDRCDRYWWYQKIAKLPTTKTPALARGSAIHKQLENWLDHGQRPTDQAALALLPMIPNPTPGLPNGPHRPYLTEQPLNLVLPGAPVPIIGAIDLLRPGHVVDFKSTRDLKWALSSDRLANDLQAVIYAYSEMLRTPNLPTYRVEWMYTVTEGPAQAEARIHDFAPQDLHAAAEEIVERLHKMQHLSTIPSGAGVEAAGVAKDSCFMYNRPCDFKQVCLQDGNRPDSNPDLANFW